MGYNFPNSPAVNQTFTPLNGPTFQWNGVAWNAVTQGMPVTVYMSDTAPVSPAPGQLWWNSTTGVMSVFYADPDSTQWVQVSGAPSGVLTAQTRNRLVNGSMQVSQENGSTVSATNGYYMADQWILLFNGITTIAGGRNSGGYTTPDNSQTLLGTYLTTAKTPLVTADYWMIQHPIEGVRLADFQWGTANAKQAVLRFSFYNNTAASGTFGIGVRNGAANRSWVGTFVAPVGWSRQVIVVPGDTTGTWPKDNTAGMLLNFAFACGPQFTAPALGWNAGNFLAPPGMTNGAAAVNNEFRVADCGLYLDPLNTGTPPRWEMPDEADELAACCRYWVRYNGAVVDPNYQTFTFSYPMRITPAASGGGAGYTVQAATIYAWAANQTTRAFQNMTYNARM